MYNTRRSYKLSREELDIDYEEGKPSILDYYLPGSKKEYRAFKKKTSVKSDKKMSYLAYLKIVKSIYTAVAELMLEYEGGVFLKRYGYFSLLILPYEKRGLKIGKYYYDSLYHTDGYRYIPILDTDASSKSCIKGMIMDRGYKPKLKKEFWKKITEENFRPKNYYTTLKSMYAHKKAKIE